MLRLISSIFNGLLALVLVVLVCSFLGTLFYGLLFAHSEMELPINHSSMAIPLLHWRNFGSLIGAGVGSLIGLGILVNQVKRSLDINWLERYGRRIAATITEIERHEHHSTSSNDRSEQTTYTYTIVARWIDPSTSIMHTFESEHLGYYPTNFGIGEGIYVFIDPYDYKKYYVKLYN